MFNSNVFDATKRVFHKHNLSSSEQEKTNITSHPTHILNNTFTIHLKVKNCMASRTRSMTDVRYYCMICVVPLPK